MNDADIIDEGEKVLIIERRQFESDLRRHLIGTVTAIGRNTLRVAGYLFVANPMTGNFERKPEESTRIIRVDNQVIINVLSPTCMIERVRYVRTGARLAITDEAGFSFDVTEYASRG